MHVKNSPHGRCKYGPNSQDTTLLEKKGKEKEKENKEKRREKERREKNEWTKERKKS